MLKIEQGLAKLANICGLKVSGERGFDPIRETKKLVIEDSKGARPLSDLLLYESYDEQEGIFYNKGSIGCWFEINPIVGSNDAIEKNLTLFFNDELPDGGYLQFLIIASHDVSHILNNWQEERKYGGEALKRLTFYRRNFIEELSKSFNSAGDGRLARNYRSFITYSMKDRGRQSIDALIKFKRQLSNKLKAENLYPEECKPVDLINTGQDLLQMNLDREDGRAVARYNPYINLSEQILEPFMPNRVESEQITHEKSGLVSRIYMPKEIPESFSLNQMINLLGDDTRSIPGRFVLSYTIANNLGSKGTSTINAAGSRVIHASSKEYTRNDLTVQEEAREWKQVKALHKKGEIFLQESMLVMLTTPKEDIDIAESVLKSLYNSYDWKLTNCCHIQRIGSLAMLPMMQSSYWQMLKFFKLTRYALSGEVVAKLPIQGEWRGVPSSGALLLGRRGQLFNFNPYYRIGGGGNYNICMMAPSGSGKSFLLQEIAQSMIAKDTAVFVLDIGASYKNICKLLGGELVQFNHNSDISLNPFAALGSSGGRYIKAQELLGLGKSIEEVAVITGLTIEKLKALEFGSKSSSNEAKEIDGIEIMEIRSIADNEKDNNSNNPTSHFVTKDSIIYAKSMLSAMCNVVGNGRDEALIERAIFEGVGRYGDELDITTLARSLESLKDREGKTIERATIMADSLYPYTKDGIHGRFFAKGAEASFKKMLTVFELEELQNDKPLLGVVLQVILMQITMQFLCGDRSRRFMLIVDEAWMILDFAASFLERFARTVRKYGGSLVVCTQDLTSFENKCGTRKSQAAILECSTWKLILQQNADGMKAFSSSESYKGYLPLIESIRKCSANKFSEVLINTDGATVVGRFAAESYSTALFSTENTDFNFLVQQEKLGVPKHEAILALAAKYGKLPDYDESEAKGKIKEKMGH